MSSKGTSEADIIYSNFLDPKSPFRGSPTRNRMAIMETMYLRVLTELSLNRFKWTGLPEGVDHRFLEMVLFYNSLAVFWEETEKYNRFFVSRATGAGPINMYDNPTRFTVISNGGTAGTGTHILGTGEGASKFRFVPIWANKLRRPDFDIITIYATKLAQIDRTIEINIDQMRTPYVALVPESKRQTFVNIFRQVREGAPVILGTEELDLERIQLFPTSVEKDQVLNLLVAKGKIWNECMTLLGINNSNQDKRERLVSDEVDANNEQIMSQRGVALNERAEAARQISVMWPNLQVTVGWNNAIDAQASNAILSAGTTPPISTDNAEDS